MQLFRRPAEDPSSAASGLSRRSRRFGRRWYKLLALALWAAPLSAGQPGRPAVDLSAMREAMGSPDDQGVYPSAASYAHFLKARLAHHDGSHRVALDELRLALASDDSNPFLMTELAEQYARLSELDRAEQQLKRVVERFPDYAPAQLLMGRVLYEANKTTRARAHLARAIKLKPTDPDAYLVLTQVWLDQGKVDDAVRVVENLGAAVPGEPIGYHRLGLALAERNDPRAEKLLVRAVERDPGDVEAWVALSKLHEAAGRIPRALDALEKALEQEPDNQDVLLAAGRLSLRLEKPQEAKAWFEQLLSLGSDPEVAVKVAFSYLSMRQLEAAADVLDKARAQGHEPRLHFYAGLVHERRRNFQKALDAFDALPPTVGELYFEGRLHRAMSLSSLGQHRAALDAFKKLSDDRPQLSGLVPAWSRAHERAGQPKEAEAMLLKLLADSPGADTFEAVSGFYERQGRLGDAVTLFQSDLKKRPDDQALRFALAVALERKGDWREGVEEMRRVLLGEPQNAAALNFVAYTLAERGGDLEEAERLMKEALEVRPESPAFLDSMGWVLHKKGDTAGALDFLERAVSGSPDEPTLLEHLGDASARAGKKSRAQEAWRRAVQLLKENPDAAERPSQRADVERKLKMLTP
ncbi:MAG: tetratricopeptide repeat protein [Myxococcota bacterium]